MHTSHVAAKFNALYPEQLVAQYQAGRRDFRAINLLRSELESIEARRKYALLTEPTEWLSQPINPRWAEFRYGAEWNFEWDSYGRFVPVELEEIPARNLRNVDLSAADFRGSYIYPVDLTGANLSRSDLRGAILLDAVLDKASLHHSDLRDASLDGARLRRADLHMARMDRSTVTNADLRKADLGRAKLKRAVFTRSDLRQAKLQKAHFDRTQLAWSDLRGTDLADIQLRYTNVSYARISRRQRGALLEALLVRIG